MSDDTRVRPDPWPIGPFLDFSGAEPPPAQPETTAPEPTTAPPAEPPGPVQESSRRNEASREWIAQNSADWVPLSSEKEWVQKIIDKRAGVIPQDDPPEPAEPAAHEVIEPLTDEDDDALPDPDPSPPAPVLGKTPPQDNGDAGWFATVKRRTALVNQHTTYRTRRILAAKYVTGAVLGWSLNLFERARDFLATIHTDPANTLYATAAAAGFYGMWRLTGAAQHIFQPVLEASQQLLESAGEIATALGRALSVIPLVGPLVTLTTGLFTATTGLTRALFSTYVPFRIIISAVGAYFAAPWGFALTGYAEAKGIDPALFAPVVIGSGATYALWWFVDRRTERWAVHPAGHLLHWASCTLTATSALAVAAYAPNAV